MAWSFVGRAMTSWWYPSIAQMIFYRSTDHPPRYWWYSPTVLNTLYSTEHPPQYLTSFTVLNILKSTDCIPQQYWSFSASPSTDDILHSTDDLSDSIDRTSSTVTVQMSHRVINKKYTDFPLLTSALLASLKILFWQAMLQTLPNPWLWNRNVNSMLVLCSSDR